MYKLSQDQNESQLAQLYILSIDKGEVRIPNLTKAKAHAFRNRLNRFRKRLRDSDVPMDENWDYVTNRLEPQPNGTWHLIMEFDKAFWDGINQLLEEGQPGLSIQYPVAPPEQDLTIPHPELQHIPAEPDAPSTNQLIMEHFGISPDGRPADKEAE